MRFAIGRVCQRLEPPLKHGKFHHGKESETCCRGDILKSQILQRERQRNIADELCHAFAEERLFFVRQKLCPHDRLHLLYMVVEVRECLVRLEQSRCAFWSYAPHAREVIRGVPGVPFVRSEEY